ncbi:putative C2H2 transcription factor [Aspergillus mulundensis]|uniref:Xylanolytic transcriptional activator regulatory domain-containing protein n=1 Tax=Aspergillus mulundensis TaxID=1810919 RepID=A0A3D8QMN7_9EURO|nr:Uncharacterized protein DSM5745_10082 [Aspergillus mulundensis]RDW62971.1 Uncharacterized protein DSM5745_10082 [Aspergillus mulundensis]
MEQKTARTESPSRHSALATSARLRGSLECQYPTERRSKAKFRKDATQTISHDEQDPLSGHSSHTFSVQGPEAHQNGRNGDPVVSSGYQVSQFQLQVPRSQNPPPSSSDDIERLELNVHSQTLLENGEDSHLAASPSLIRSDVTAASGAMPPTFPSFCGINEQLYPHPPPTQLQSIPVEQRRFSFPLGGRQPEISVSGAAVSGNPSSENQHMHMSFSQSLLTQPGVSTINWLSSDLIFDSVSDNGLPSVSLQPPLQSGVFDNSLSQTTWLPPVINAEPHGSSLSGSISQTTPSGTTSFGDVESPGNFVRGLRQSSQSGPSKRPAEYSVDDPLERPSKHKRKQSSWPMQPSESLDIFLKIQSTNAKPRFAFPPPNEVQPSSLPDTTVDCNLEASTYDRIRDAFTQLCCTEHILYPKFETNNFPSAQALSRFLHHYFRFAHPLCPIIHTPTFNPNKCHWIVALALAAIGSHSANHCEQNGTATAFHEFLRRALCVEKEKRQSEPLPLWFIQAMLLNCIGRLHGNNESGKLSALGDFGDLINLATRERLLSRLDYSDMPKDQPSSEHEWSLWVEEEARRRTGYLIWLVDCTAAYEYDTKPYFSLDDGQAPLPCNEKIWHATSSRIWKGLREETSEQDKISLYDAVLILYIEKRLVSGIGELSHILLIHALYHRMWEVGDYFRRPLSFWNPTAKKQSRKLAIPSGSVWLPGIPSYSKWRNSACDCLDILHWTANGTIAKANGHEHPTILHLHTARIILLAPFREIRLLVNLLATQKVNWEDRQQVIEWHYVLRWIKHDQYKARLAVIHAGSVLYHVRKFSTKAFHEPVATYLAILTLWAYGLCYKQASPELTAAQRDSSTGPSTINLDQPCSDELVQSFVREGQRMKGMLTNVGDICAPHGPEQILRAGCETLSSLHSWGIAKEFMVTLMRLVEFV